uniref:Viral helicase n=1 Tax=Murindo virus TaxID=2689363 RepID=A0A6B9KGL9_9VIRU|nr:viral helicase [Murindo virus]
MEFILDAVLPLVADKVYSALTPKSTDTPTPAMLPSDINHVTPLPLPIQQVTAPVKKPPTPLSSVKIPFQHLYYDLTGTESKTASTTVVELAPIRQLTRFYRVAQLENVEAVIFAGSASVENPVTVDLVWTTADITSAEPITTPGGIRFTIGGLNVTNSGILPCPLHLINPIIKAPVSFHDSPRLCVKFHQTHNTVTTQKSASIVIRGTLILSEPSIYV